jgi:hypothetical protein
MGKLHEKGMTQQASRLVLTSQGLSDDDDEPPVHHHKPNLFMQAYYFGSAASTDNRVVLNNAPGTGNTAIKRNIWCIIFFWQFWTLLCTIVRTA